jgi:hypothetical protein
MASPDPSCGEPKEFQKTIAFQISLKDYFGVHEWLHAILKEVLEFPFDTTRAVTHLTFSGTLERCPEARIIIPHNGGVLLFRRCPDSC